MGKKKKKKIYLPIKLNGIYISRPWNLVSLQNNKTFLWWSIVEIQIYDCY